MNQDYLDSSKRVPLRMLAKLRRTFVNAKGQKDIEHFPVNIDLYSQDRKLPKWYEHPVLGRLCDVVAFSYERPEGVDEAILPYSNKINSQKIPLYPGGDVSIVGFPGNSTVNLGPTILPIWKSGFLASELDFDITLGGQFDEQKPIIGGTVLPATFIDAQTRPGMSGSPVFARFTGKWLPGNPYQRPTNYSLLANLEVEGTGIQFLGVYSGRVGSREDQAALGLCWREKAIIAICDSAQLGKHPHI